MSHRGRLAERVRDAERSAAGAVGAVGQHLRLQPRPHFRLGLEHPRHRVDRQGDAFGLAGYPRPDVGLANVPIRRRSRFAQGFLPFSLEWWYAYGGFPRNRFSDSTNLIASMNPKVKQKMIASDFSKLGLINWKPHGRLAWVFHEGGLNIQLKSRGRMLCRMHWV